MVRWAAHVRDGDKVQKFTGTTSGTFWDRIEKYTSRGRNVWIICPDAATSFRALDGWILSDQGEITWGSLSSGSNNVKERDGRGQRRGPCTMILSPAVTILVHEFSGGRCTWVSLSNYLPPDIGQIAKAVNIPYTPGADAGPHGIAWHLDCKSTAVILGEFFRTVMDRFKADDGGHWKSTAAQLSHQTFRRRFYDRDLVEHREPSAAKMDRDALYGGRAELRYFGSVGRGIVAPDQWLVKAKPFHPAVIPGPVHKLDIRSQYPAIMRDRTFPVALDRKFGPISIAKLSALCEYRCPIARVVIDTDIPAYPLRLRNVKRTEKGFVEGHTRVQTDYLGSQTVFPLGKFTTTLCGPELAMACRRGHVIECLGGWEYRPGKPFEAYATWLINERDQARSSGDECREIMRKLQANSFAGKWASRGGGWVVDKNIIPETRWGEWSAVDFETGDVKNYRAISGIVQRFERDDNEPKGFPSIFAYLTSYGRCQIYEIMEAAGNDNVIWVNTDGIVVTDEGLGNLGYKDFIGNGEAGRLRIDGKIHDFAGYGHNHYCADGQWTLSGYQSGIIMTPGGGIIEVAGPGISGMIADAGGSTVEYTQRRKHMPVRPVSGHIDDRGFWKPRDLRPARIAEDNNDIYSLFS